MKKVSTPPPSSHQSPVNATPWVLPIVLVAIAVVAPLSASGALDFIDAGRGPVANNGEEHNEESIERRSERKGEDANERRIERRHEEEARRRHYREREKNREHYERCREH
jgi:hypothetical protein